MNQVEIYQTSDHQTQVEVHFDEETVWLNQQQIAEVFGTQRPAITKHLNNIFLSGELDEIVVSSILEHTTSHGAMKGKTQKKKVKYYNLDAIISIGYRVNSQKATAFRIWATQRLKEYLVKGYAINQKRLQETEGKFRELKQAIVLLEGVAHTKELSGNEAKGLLKVLSDYTFALDVLDKYDHQALQVKQTSTKEVFRITYPEAKKAIEALKKQFGGGDLFGNEKDKSFKGSLDGIYQTFDGKELYFLLEEKAAHLLYFVVKNHSFSDGNKRIAAFLFVWFLERNNLLYHEGKKIIDDNALVALTLMIAQSHPNDKDIMVKVIINLINNKS